MKREKQVELLFINPPAFEGQGKFSRENRSAAVTRSGTLYYPLWLIYAAALCEQEGFNIAFLDAVANGISTEESLKFVQKHPSANVVVIDTSTPSIVSDISFADKVKSLLPKAFVILVGTHPSALAQETLQMGNLFDAVARREFDQTIVQIAHAISNGEDPYKVRGISFRTQDKNIVENPDMSYLQNLDRLPFAAEFIHRHLDVRQYFFSASAYPEVQIFTSRGCANHCNFCVYPQTMHGHLTRMRSEENIVEEFRYIAEKMPEVKEVVIEDDTFTTDQERVKRFCELLIASGLNKKLRWLCNARANLKAETMHMMKMAGCNLVVVGIESGSQQILNNIRKGIRLEQVRTFVKDARHTGLRVHACYMVGNRGETKESMNETLHLAMELNTDTAQFYPLQPFPGTEAYQWAKENGYIHGGFSDYCKADGTLNSVPDLPGLSSSDMTSFCDFARKKYYCRPRYIMRRLWIGLHDIEDLKRSIKAFLNLRHYLYRK